MQWKDYLKDLEKMRDSTRSPSKRCTTRRYATGGSVKSALKAVASKGRYGDTQLAYIGPRTAKALDMLIHRGHTQINPRTGLREYPPKGGGKGKGGKFTFPSALPRGVVHPGKKGVVPHLSQMNVGGKNYHTACGAVTGYANLLGIDPKLVKSYKSNSKGALKYFDREVGPRLTGKKAPRKADPDLLGGGKTVFPGDVMKTKGVKLNQFRSRMSPIYTSAGKFDQMGENENISPTRLKQALDDHRVVSMVGTAFPGTQSEYHHAINLTGITPPAPPTTTGWQAEISDPMHNQKETYPYIHNQDNPFGTAPLPDSDVSQVNSYWYSQPVTDKTEHYPPLYSQTQMDELYNPTQQPLTPTSLKKQQKAVKKEARKIKKAFGGAGPLRPAGYTGNKWP